MKNSAKQQNITNTTIGVLSSAGALVILLFLFDLLFPKVLGSGNWVTILATVCLVALTVFLVRSFQRLSLQTKITFAFLLVALIPLVFHGYISNSIIQKAMSDNANLALSSAAKQSAQSIDSFITTNLDGVRTQSLLPEFSAYLDLHPKHRRGSVQEKAAQDLLSILSRRDSLHISSYALLDTKGMALIDTYGNDAQPNKAQTPYFQVPMETGLPYVSDLTLSSATKVLSLFFSCPVRNPKGNVVGLLRIRYDTSILQSLVFKSTGLLGQNSFAVLVDEFGLRLADGGHPEDLFTPSRPLLPAEIATLGSADRLPLNFAPRKDDSFSPELSRVLREPTLQQFFATTLHRGRPPVQCAMIPLAKRPWFVIFAMPQADLLNAAKTQAKATAYLLAIITVIAALVAILAARLLAAPVLRLTRLTVRLRDGDLSHRAHVEATDEIGQLARSFNAMAAALELSQNRILTASNRLQALLDTIPDTVLVFTLDGRIADVNRSCERVTGYTPAELINGDAQIFSGEGYTREIVLQRLHECIKRGFMEFEWMARHKNGREFKVLVRLHKLTLPEGERILAIATDISAMKEAQAEIDAVRRYLKNVIDSMPSVLIGVDQNIHVTQWNQEVEQETGIPAGKALGRRLDEVFPRLTYLLHRIQAVMADGIPWEQTRMPFERHGQIHYENVTVYPVTSGASTGAVIRLDNVTESIRLAEQLLQSQKMDAIGQLAGGVAHDFNNMLAGIIGAAELLTSRISGDEKTRRALSMIIETSERAAGLIGKLLMFSRHGKMQAKPFDIHRVTDDALGILERSIDRRISIVRQYDAEQCIVIGDPVQIQNAILNLCINARDAMPAGGTLSVATTNLSMVQADLGESSFEIQPGLFIQITISDTGSGISPEIMNHIFEPFFTTKEVGKGTGLGLPAVYGTIKDHKGAVTVKSELGQGTVFRLYLPVVLGETCGLEESEQTKQGSGTVLVIDDEPVIREVAAELLSDLGYEVLLAEDGEEGAAVFKANMDRIDLVLLDMVMPKKNGAECFQAIRALSPRAKVIISSGFARDASMDKLQDQGVIGFIKKPYRLAEFSRIVNEAIGRSK